MNIEIINGTKKKKRKESKKKIKAMPKVNCITLL